jgi:formylglycine-generating enzyme required for sulfatase activity/class 3 adenylate cyclase
MAEIRDIKFGRSNKQPRDATPRRLAAIVAGDISGYSRLMQLDEEGTHARVKRIERDVIEPNIAEHRGSLVKTTGDGFIAIFDSPVEAVRFGIVLQQNMIGRNASLPKHHWIEFRIGVNLGDVIVEADDIYGDGVNIASRLEGIADPGQVYISSGIYEQVRNKLVCGYESLGDRKVKNIAEPVRVYRVLADPAAFHEHRKRRENILFFLLSLILLVVASGVLWYVLLQPNGKLGKQALAPVSPPAENVPSSPPPAVKQAAPPPTPSSASVPPTPQATPQPQSASSATPAAQPVSAVREPEMNPIGGGSFIMGSTDDVTEKPTHQVTIKPFAIGKYPTTVHEWNECAAAKACGFVATGKDDAPVTNVSWSDAKQFVAWLAGATRRAYRLPSEAEWEYAARGGTQSKYWWGDQFEPGIANCKNCTDIAAAEQPIKVGSFKPNPFGLYEMGGGVDQWVEDCWHKNYQGAPADGSPWVEGECPSHVIRSGSWKNDARYVRPSNRDSYDSNVRYPTHGFRVLFLLKIS